jgi:hypothetical protein
MITRIRHLINRVNVYILFLDLKKNARLLELELQKHEQDFFDFKFRCQMSRDQKDEQLLIKQGFLNGVKWCLDWANKK